MSQPAGDGPVAAREALRQQPHTEEPDQKRPTRARSAWSLLREVGGILVTAIVLSMLVKTFFVQAFFIPSESMEPALQGCATCVNGDRVLVNKLTSHMGGVQRGDIVVFRDANGWLPHTISKPGLQHTLHDALASIGLAPETSENHLVKRVIGVGGDTVEGRGGNVYVNGTRLDEPYVFPGEKPTDIKFRVKVPLNTLWVMGDHRAESGDSRFHEQDPGRGFIPVSDVEGRAFVLVWPLSRFGSLDRPATFDQPFVPARR
jgi:signal peptidase I